MKHFAGICIGVILFFTACKKEKSELSDGMITGVDYRECACCGGYYIDIDTCTYRFQALPANSDLILDEAEFPMPVALRWKKDINACIGDEVIIEYIEKR